MFKKLIMLFVVAAFMAVAQPGQAQKKTPVSDRLKEGHFQLEAYDRKQYTGLRPITLNFNEAGNPNFMICGRNIVTAAPGGGAIWEPNSTFASSPSSYCPDQESSEISKIFYEIIKSGGTGATDKGETFYILTNTEHILRFKRAE